MKNSIWQFLSSFFKIAGIIFLIIFLRSLYVIDQITYNHPSFDIEYNLMWIGLACIPICGILWLVLRIKSEKVKSDIENAKNEELRKIEETKRKEEYDKMIKAYNEISDVWPYGNNTKLAVVCKGNIYALFYVALNYSNKSAEPWSITLKDTDSSTKYCKVKRVEDSLVGFCGEKKAIMTKGQLKIGEMIVLFDSNHDYVKHVETLKKLLMTEKKIETVRVEHFKKSAGNIDALPKFHFSISDKGIKCDEINYPQKQLDDFFEKHNGNDNIYQNKVFYFDYCKNGNLDFFSPDEEHAFENYMHEMSKLCHKLDCTCKTDFSIVEWNTVIKTGINSLYKSIKSYVSKKTLDVIPSFVTENSIVFQHKDYTDDVNIKNKSKLIKSLAITNMSIERNENPVFYSVSIVESRIIVTINDESFVCTSLIK